MQDPVAAAQALGWRHNYFNLKSIPFWGVHVAAIVGIVMLGWSWRGALLTFLLFLPRMFLVTAGYHRYFSHRSYKTSRWFQFLLALGCAATSQKGVLWWSSHHRLHHKLSDQPGDFHSPRYGFWWSHIGWILSPEFETTEYDRVKDLYKYPELRWLDRWWILPPIAVAVLMYVLAGPWGLVWGFFVVQSVHWHATFTINSLTHIFGKRVYQTSDDSKNHWGLALLTFGEGWHNNHHHYQVSARQGFHWWQVDLSFYILKALSWVGLVWDLHGVPDHIRTGHSEACGSPPPTFSSDAPS